MATRRRTGSTLSRFAIAAMLLAVQVTVAGHIDLDGHSQETQCAICVSVSTLDAANVSDHELIVAVVRVETPVAAQLLPGSNRRDRHRRARAPPVAS